MELFHINIKFIANFWGSAVLPKFNLIGVCEKIRWFCKNQLNWSKNTPTDNITWILANEPRLTLCVLLGRSSFESSFEKNRNLFFNKKPVLLGRYRMIKLTHVKKSILLFILSNLATTSGIYAGDTPSVEGTKIYFVTLNVEIIKN